MLNEIKYFFEDIGRFFYWGWNLRKSYDFDYGYLEQIMLVKMKRIQKCLLLPRSYRKITKQDERRLSIIVNLLERQVKDEYICRHYEVVEKLLGKTWRDLMWKDDMLKLHTELSEEDILMKNELRRAGKRGMEQEQVERERLYYMLGKYGRTFWD